MNFSDFSYFLANIGWERSNVKVPMSNFSKDMFGFKNFIVIISTENPKAENFSIFKYKTGFLEVCTFSATFS